MIHPVIRFYLSLVKAVIKKAIPVLHGFTVEEFRGREQNQHVPEYEVKLTVEEGKPDREQLIRQWDYKNKGQFSYGDGITYKKGMAFLDAYGTIEDWGCGTAYAKNFVKKSKYVGIDGSQSNFTDKVVDLREYTSKTDCIFMRDVLEHNHGWKKILANAVNSFTKRMVLIIFTPFADVTQQIATNYCPNVPDISFRKEDLTEFFNQFSYTEESLEADTQYKTEHIFYIEK